MQDIAFRNVMQRKRYIKNFSGQSKKMEFIINLQIDIIHYYF